MYPNRVSVFEVAKTPVLINCVPVDSRYSTRYHGVSTSGSSSSGVQTGPAVNVPVPRL